MGGQGSLLLFLCEGGRQRLRNQGVFQLLIFNVFLPFYGIPIQTIPGPWSQSVSEEFIKNGFRARDMR